MIKLYSFIFLIFIFFSGCGQSESKNIDTEVYDKEIKEEPEKDLIITGAEQPYLYMSFLKNKRVAVVANQSSKVGDKHLLDFLLEKGINVVKVFALEHGFRGNLDRGEHFDNTKDEKTGVEIVAVFGKNRKPKKEQLADSDVIIFDIQDVGVRFYTYISSMHNIMEACAETGKEFIVFDRPNPLGDYIDGPVREEKYKSFVGMHPIPIVHGLTVGELSEMINGEKWLSEGIQCNLTVIKVKNYKHNMKWSIPIKPSPNLPNDISIRLYPSLCFFEATDVSIGRGTDYPFQIIGYPDSTFGKYTFTPEDKPGMQMNPLQESKKCYGIDLRKSNTDIKFTLKYLIEFAKKFPDKKKFITREKWFNLLAGNGLLQKQILNGMNELQIRKTWENELSEYKKIRKKYLLYPDFE